LDSVRQSGLEGTVILPGFVPREELPVFYSAACVVIYPTLYEGFGLPVLEAMACATPLVSSNISSIPEIAGDAALLVDPENPHEISEAVQRLLTDKTLRAELVSRGLMQVREFTWHRVAEMTLKVFLGVAEKRRRLPCCQEETGLAKKENGK
ncbi:MAG: glycosyltransferase family 4 protein, partial [Candidatus Eremiobacteraeota bacterium]|nr:glycosyltransferase family 4 protein [Candidatus Eremiobacteraeota bacterium]